MNRTIPFDWIQGNTPAVILGTRRRFLAAIKRDNGKFYTLELEYLNRYAMACADGCDPPANAEEVGDGEGVYLWSGWHQPSCDHCDTSWAYSDAEKIVAYMPMPVYLGSIQELSEETKSSD